MSQELKLPQGVAEAAILTPYAHRGTMLLNLTALRAPRHDAAELGGIFFGGINENGIQNQ